MPFQSLARAKVEVYEVPELRCVHRAWREWFKALFWIGVSRVRFVVAQRRGRVGVRALQRSEAKRSDSDSESRAQSSVFAFCERSLPVSSDGRQLRGWLAGSGGV